MSWLGRDRSDRLSSQEADEGATMRGDRSRGRSNGRSVDRSRGRSGGRSTDRSSRDYPTGTSKRRRSTSERFIDSARKVRKRLSNVKKRFSRYKHPVYDIPGSQSEQGHGGPSREAGTGTGPGALSAAREGFNNYTSPVYDGAPNQQHTDSESERRSEGSSTGRESAASTTPSSVGTTPSSVGSQTPPVGTQTPPTSNAPSVAVAPAPTTSQDTDTRPSSQDTDTRPEEGRKREVHIPDKYLQPKQLSAFDDFPMEKKTALAKETYMSAGGTEEGWQTALKKPYGKRKMVSTARDKFKKKEDADRATTSGEETKAKVLPTLDKFSVIDAVEKKIMPFVRGTLASVGGATKPDVIKYTLSLLDEYLHERYAGSLKDLQWPEGWRKNLKPPSDDQITGLLRGKEEMKLYEDWRVRNAKDTIIKRDGTEVTDADAREYFSRKPGNGYATFKRSDPICSQLTNFRKFATTTAPPEFEKLTEKELKRAKEMKVIADKTTEGGGTEADVENALDEAFGPKPATGPRHVFFPNAEGTMTGTMGDGTVVTMTCGSPPPSTGQVTIDTAAANPFILDDPDGKIKKEWAGIEAAATEVKKQVAAEQVLEQEAMKKAIAKQKAKLKLMPSQNKATDLLSIPKTANVDSSATMTSPTDSSPSKPVTSWNGYDELTWASSGQPVTKDNGKQALNRLLMDRNIRHLLGQKFPELDKETLFQMSSAVADSSLGYKSFKYDTVLSQMPEVLAKQGCQITKEELKTLFQSKDRPKIGGRVMRDWVSRPSGRPGTAEPVHPAEACSRLMRLSVISSKLDAQKLPISSQSQKDEISGWVSDLLDGAASEADCGAKLEAAISRAKKELAEKPKWIPDANTTLEP